MRKLALVVLLGTVLVMPHILSAKAQAPAPAVPEATAEAGLAALGVSPN